MIHRIYSPTLKSFKTLDFQEGLNVLLADKSEGATSRHTRNGAGKSSMVEFVHFFLGATCGKRSIFRNESLVDHRFGIMFDLDGQRVEAERSGSLPSRIYVRADTSDWPFKGKPESQTGMAVIPNTKWRELLGKLVFDLPADSPKFSPTFRSSFSYFARRVNDGAFLVPVQHFKNQKEWDQQANLSHLIGLDWRIPSEMEHVRLKETSLKTLRRELKKGVMGEIIGSVATLKTKLTVAERNMRKLREEIASFQVLPEYKNLEQEASELTLRLAEMSNRNTIDEETVRDLEEALASEHPPELKNIRELYEEAGVVLPGLAVKRLGDVELFHAAIIKNRQSHLRGEIDDTTARIKRRREEMEQIDERRRQIMTILSSHGALEQFTNLQEELNRVQADVGELRKRHELAREIESTDADLSLERKKLKKRLMDDHREREPIVEEAIITFEDLSAELSEREGSLTIGATDRGPVFEVRVEAGRSKGITNMQIFCVDMMLAVLCRKRNLGPGYLIHDSHLFDGMDSRQIAKALEIGARTADKYGFQYIVTLNSDMVPYSEFSTEFGFEDHVLPVVLTDATEDGGLFGFRFE